MGYYMTQLHYDFFIAAKDLPDVHKAIVNLANETHRGSGGRWTDEGQVSSHFAWVNTEELAAAKTTEEALKIWLWNPDFDDEGNIIELVFKADKLGNEEIMFDEIAPWVRDGSFILMAGEEGYVWRWYFQGGRCLHQDGIIEFKTVDGFRW